MIDRVVIGGLFSFPYGEAASSRLRNLALGFKSHIDDILVISLYQNDQCEFKRSGLAVVDGIELKYKSIIPSIKESSDMLQRVKNRAYYVRYYKYLIDEIIDNLRGDEKELLFLYGRSYLFLSLLLKKIQKLSLKTRLVFDVVEPPRTTDSLFEYIQHPFVWDSVLVFKKLLGRFQACTFISYTLKDKYGHLANKNCIVPSISYSYSRPETKAIDKHLKIGYIGALIDKDHPKLMYQICEKLFEKGVDFELTIMGRFKYHEEGRRNYKMFRASDFSKQINFVSDPSEEEKISAISTVDYMFSLRKPGLVQYFTFPTRVTELLSLGKVLIINSYGDYERYFKNNVNSIVVSLDGLDEGAQKIIESLNINNYRRLQDNGLRLLDNEFNSIIQCGRLLEKIGE